MTDTLLPTMAEPKTENIRVSKTITEKARMVAARRRMSMPEYLASILGPVVDADWEAEADAIARERAAKSKKK